MTHWTHGHTFVGGLLAGLALAVHLWVLLAVVAAGGALGAGLLLLAVGLAHRVSDALEGRRQAQWNRLHRSDVFARYVARDDHWSRKA